MLTQNHFANEPFHFGAAACAGKPGVSTVLVRFKTQCYQSQAKGSNTEACVDGPADLASIIGQADRQGTWRQLCKLNRRVNGRLDQSALARKIEFFWFGARRRE